MDDNTVLRHISALADEELRLEEAEEGQTPSKEVLARLHDIDVELDQCWDLLRQRRARRTAGQDPDLAALRSETVVEKYLQ
jgi:Protein of unknown function (DUF2630)